MVRAKAGSMQPLALIIFAGFIMAAAPLSNDGILPNLATIAMALQVSTDQIKLVVPSFFITLGIGHVIWGPLSDRYGRRTPLLIGLVIFTIGHLVAALSQDITTLLAARSLQGFGAAAGTLLSRSILRDTLSGKELAKAMAAASMVFGIVPMVAPIIGWWIQVFFGWRMVFIGSVVMTLIALTWAFFSLQETNKHQHAHFSLLDVMRGIRAIWRHPQSRQATLTAMGTTILITSNLANSPLVFKQALGWEGVSFAAIFGATGLMIIVGQRINMYMIHRYGTIFTTKFGTISLIIQTIMLTAIGFYDLVNGYTLGGVFIFFFFGHMIIYANCASLVLDPHQKTAGLTASVFGLMNLSTGAIVTALTVTWVSGNVTHWGVFSFVCALPTLTFLLFKAPAEK